MFRWDKGKTSFLKENMGQQAEQQKVGGVKEVEQPLAPGPVSAAGTIVIPEEEQGRNMPRFSTPQQVVRRAGQASQVEQVIGRTGEQADGIDGKQTTSV